ncbi:MAG: hypothetical protein E7357_00505 [Clostridiales bacterium]|nr:hypothetical protein [Clostridiales bacterium]
MITAYGGGATCGCCTWGYFAGRCPTPHKGLCLAQRAVYFALGHRSRGQMRSLISPLQGIINALLNGQLTLDP